MISDILSYRPGWPLKARLPDFGWRCKENISTLGEFKFFEAKLDEILKRGLGLNENRRIFFLWDWGPLSRI